MHFQSRSLSALTLTFMLTRRPILTHIERENNVAKSGEHELVDRCFDGVS
jgi:hypothetical protein